MVNFTNTFIRKCQRRLIRSCTLLSSVALLSAAQLLSSSLNTCVRMTWAGSSQEEVRDLVKSFLRKLLQLQLRLQQQALLRALTNHLKTVFLLYFYCDGMIWQNRYVPDCRRIVGISATWPSHEDYYGYCLSNYLSIFFFIFVIYLNWSFLSFCLYIDSIRFHFAIYMVVLSLVYSSSKLL